MRSRVVTGMRRRSRRWLGIKRGRVHGMEMIRMRAMRSGIHDKFNAHSVVSYESSRL